MIPRSMVRTLVHSFLTYDETRGAWLVAMSGIGIQKAVHTEISVQFERFAILRFLGLSRTGGICRSCHPRPRSVPRAPAATPALPIAPLLSKLRQAEVRDEIFDVACA